MSAESVLGIIGASLALADALLGPTTNTTTRTTRQQERTRSSYTQSAQRNNNQNTQVRQVNRTQAQTQTTSKSPTFSRVDTGSPPQQQYQGQPATVSVSSITPAKSEGITPLSSVVTPPPPPPPPPKVEVTEEEKFLLGFLPSLYGGDKDAIMKNTDGCESGDELSNLIIEDQMRYSQAAEAHKGYASAKVISRSTREKQMVFKTVVTFKDESTEEGEFSVIRNSSDVLKYYVE